MSGVEASLIASYQQGRMDEAAALAERLLAGDPRSELGHVVLGAALLTLGRHAEAERALRRAHGLGLRTPAICNNLGIAIADQGRAEEAIGFYREAIAADPAYAIARNSLGNALKACGRPVEALEAYAQATANDPGYVDAWNNMGLVLDMLGRPDDARAAYGQALALKPDHAAVHNNLGNVETGHGDFAAAVACYQRALAIRPDYPEAWYNLGNLLKRMGRTADAITAYQRARAARPDYADAAAELGKTLALEARFDEAIAAFDEALAAAPDHAGAQAHKLFYQAHMCEWSAFAAWRGLDAAADAEFSPFAALTFADDPAALLRRSRAWAKRTFARPAPPLPPSPPAPDGRIRLGYFSADFHDHATPHLMAGLLREHDRARFEVHAFSYGPSYDDAMRRQIVASVEHFHEVGGQPDAALVDLARGCRLDIAIDLKGYTQNTRMQPFAQRLAPVQIAYLGYPGSSGADFIDYLVADPVVIPEAERSHYSEQLILLPDSYQPNDDRRPIAGTAGRRADWGLPEAGTVLCCFNHTYKITPREFAIWMRVLGQLPETVLWLLGSNRWAEDNLRRAARAHGIAPERLVFAGYAPQAEHLARLRHADLFVDTFHVNAHTTASDALWAGVPLVTLAGRQFAARVGASLVSAVGLPELVTTSEADYEALVLDLAGRPDRLAAIRARLAANRLTAPLFDTVRYTRHLETALAAVHRRRLDGQMPATLAV